MGPTPILDSFKRGEVGRDTKLMAAAGTLAPHAYEQLALLVLLVDDADQEVRTLAEATLAGLPAEALQKFLDQPDTPAELLEFFARRAAAQAERAAAEAPLDAILEDEVDEHAPDADAKRQSISQQLAKMAFPQKLKAAVKGNREIRSILVRDPSKMIAAAVLSSPKVTDAEVAGFARMGNVSEDVLRIIGKNRSWTKNYSVVLALTKNAKTPVAMSMMLMHRLSDRDLAVLATDRNVPEALRVAARKKVSAGQQK